jgi:hypothetical protein
MRAPFKGALGPALPGNRPHKIGKSMLNVNGKGGYFTGKSQVNIM